MRDVRVCVTIAAAIVTAMPGVATAQFPPPPGTPPATVQERWPSPPRVDRGPADTQQPAQRRQPAAENSDAPESAPKPAAKPAPKPAVARSPANEVACSGVFARESSHLKLAIKYDSRNIVFGEVDASDGSKVRASILFPNDPRRRVEVLWDNEASRSETNVIAINGKSQWSAPKGLKLGLPLAALEKANGRPFKLTGIGSDGTFSVAGWEGGALSALPGGCKISARLAADPKVPQEARQETAGSKDLLSNDERLRALKATIVEILIGY